MNSSLITEASKGQESAKINFLSDELSIHVAQNLEAHASEGIVNHQFFDSGGNSLSPLSLKIGGIQNGVAVNVYLPLAQNPTPISSNSNTFEFVFNGIKFVNDDDFEAAITTVKDRIEAASLTIDEIVALTTILSTLSYGSVEDDYSFVVNGVTYSARVIVTNSSGYILIRYVR